MCQLRAMLLIAGLLMVSISHSQSELRQITLLHVNDTHGRYMPWHAAPGNVTAQTGDPGREPQSFDREGLVGGAAHLATAVRRIVEERGADDVALLHGGDAFSDDLLGNITKGEATIRIMNAIGFRFMALGNHDFDYGVQRTRELQQIAAFPMRGANILQDGAPFLGDPTDVFTLAGVRVGILALGYHNTDQTGSRENVSGLEFVSGIEAARAHLPALMKRADVIVVLSHQGSRVDRELAKQVSGIDLIIGAHSHDLIAPAERVGNTRIVQALSDGAVLGEVRLSVDERGDVREITEHAHVLWTAQYRADPQIARLVEQWRAPHREQLEEVIATARERIGRRYRSESPFDVLVGGILKEHTGSEVAFLPGVGYGVSLERGPVTREALFTLLPHPSKIVTMQLSGAQILEILEQSATNQHPRNALDRVGGLVQTAGLTWTADLTRPEGQRVRDVAVGDRRLDGSRLYTVVTHSGMQQGLHRYRTFAEGRSTKIGDSTVTEVVEKRLREMKEVRPPALGHVTLIRAME